MKWCGTLPIRFKIDASVPPELAPVVYDGATAWNNVGFGELVQAARAGDRDPVVIKWTADGKGLCGLSPSTIETGSPCVVGREIMLYSSCATNTDWVMPVVAHELGHVLGLEHSRDAHDLMFPSVGPSQVFTDYESEELRKRYAPR